MSIPVRYLLAACVTADHSESPKFNIGGVCVTDTHIVSTDIHRLFSIEHDTGLKPGTEIIIPIATIDQLAKQSPHPETVELTYVTDELWMIGDVYFKPIDGKFPKWAHLIPRGQDVEPWDYFQWKYMLDFEKMDKLLCAETPTARLITHGMGGASVILSALPEAQCVLMPCRVPSGD